MIRKSSKQRDMILNYMKQIEGHVTPEQVFQEMNAGGQKNQSGNDLSKSEYSL